jgi:hypothetical protein
MPNTILKRWNGSAFEELYPKTTVTQISASGTANNTTFLRGDGQWQIPATQAHTHAAADVNSGTFATARIPTLGNITNAGAVQNSLLTPGSGHYLLVANNQGGDLVSRTSVQFGSGTTTFLRNDGQWGSLTASVALATTSVIGGMEIGFTSTETNRAVSLSGNKGIVALPRQIPVINLNGTSNVTTATLWTSTTSGTSGQFLRSNGSSAPSFQNSNDLIGTSSAINSSTDYSVSVTGYRMVVVSIWQDTTVGVADFTINLTDSNQYSTTTRNYRFTWNNGAGGTFGNTLQVQNVSGNLRLRHGSGANMSFKVTGIR